MTGQLSIIETPMIIHCEITMGVFENYLCKLSGINLRD